MRIINKNITELYKGWLDIQAYQKIIDTEYKQKLADAKDIVIASRINKADAKKRILMKWALVFLVLIGLVTGLLVTLNKFSIDNNISELLVYFINVDHIEPTLYFLGGSFIILLIYNRILSFCAYKNVFDIVDRTEIDTNITEKWFEKISQEHQIIDHQTTGTQGEVDLLKKLKAYYGDNYYAFPNVKVKDNLDADLIVIGPQGLQIFESKYWSGQIVKRCGQWEHYKVIGWNRDIEYRNISFDPDIEWMTVAESVAGDINRMRIDYEFETVPEISGGIIFTHPKATFDIADSEVAWCNMPALKSFLSQQRTKSPIGKNDVFYLLDNILQINRSHDHGLFSKSGSYIANAVYQHKIDEIQSVLSMAEAALAG